MCEVFRRSRPIFCETRSSAEKGTTQRPANNIWCFERRRNLVEERTKVRTYVATRTGDIKITGHTILDTDVCTVRVARVLLQQHQDVTAKPMSYWLGSLTDTERKHDTKRRERLAIVWTLMLFCFIFRGDWSQHKNGSQFPNVDFESLRKYEQTRALAFATFRIRVWRSSRNRLQALSRVRDLAVAYPWGRQRNTQRWTPIARDREDTRPWRHTHLCDTNYWERRHTIW